MKITPINYHRPIKFTSQINHHHPNPPQSPWSQDEFSCDSFLDNGSKTANTIIGIMIGTIIGILGTASVDTSHSKNFAKKIIDTFESEDLKKDSMILTDITGDEQADIILLKEDGSKVVIDLFNQEIIENDSESN